jgi:putative hydrolase of HD superfamily
MELKADLPYGLLRGKNAHAIIEAYFEFNHLKQLYRQGWLKRGISKEHCESVADHTFGVAVLGYLLADSYLPQIDAGRVLRLALLHDFGEIYAGDIIPSSGVPAEDKHRLEAEAVKQVLGKLPKGAEYLALWQEYEDQASPEAIFVRQIDRLEMALQASVYEHQGSTEMGEFFDSAALAISEAQLLAIMQNINELRRV